jgi:hypothetical protein
MQKSKRINDINAMAHAIVEQVTSIPTKESHEKIPPQLLLAAQMD